MHNMQQLKHAIVCYNLNILVYPLDSVRGFCVMNTTKLNWEIKCMQEMSIMSFHYVLTGPST